MLKLRALELRVEEMYVVPPPERSGSGSDRDLRVYQTWKGSNVSSFFSKLSLIFMVSACS